MGGAFGLVWVVTNLHVSVEMKSLRAVYDVRICVGALDELRAVPRIPEQQDTWTRKKNVGQETKGTKRLKIIYTYAKCISYES